MAKNSSKYDDKYMEIKFISDNDLPLNKSIEIPSMIIILKAVFHENNKYYPKVFLDECLYKLCRRVAESFSGRVWFSKFRAGLPK